MPVDSVRTPAVGRAAEKIPIPWRERWRSFVTEILPAMIFGVAVLLAAWLWQISGATPTLVAEAEMIVAEAKSLRPGIVTQLQVAPMAVVAAGDVIARVATADPAGAAAALDLVRAELDLLQATLEPTLELRKLEIDRGRLQLEWMRESVTLASLRGQLQQAEADLARIQPLREKQISSEEAFQTARVLRDRLAAQVLLQDELITKLRAFVADAELPESSERKSSTLDPLTMGIRVLEQKLRVIEAQFAPALVVAPMAGVISTIHRRNGEAVLAGEAIVTISAVEATRLVGYLRQPVQASPEIGQTVEIRTRALPRMTARATVVEVGVVMESLPETVLARFNRAGNPESGLRVQISRPPNVPLRPGEIVDVVIPHRW